MLLKKDGAEAWEQAEDVLFHSSFIRRPAHWPTLPPIPCQPFSIAGVSKKLSLGKKHGFEDKEQGNLFFKLAELIDHHRPDAFELENLKHLKSTREYQALVSS